MMLSLLGSGISPEHTDWTGFILLVKTLNSEVLNWSNLASSLNTCHGKMYFSGHQAGPLSEDWQYESNVVVRDTQLRIPPLMCPLSLRPCSMSLMSSRSSLMTLIKWLKPSCCCFKCWKVRKVLDLMLKSSWTRVLHRAVIVLQIQGHNKGTKVTVWCTVKCKSAAASLVWFLWEGLHQYCSVLLISQFQSDSASGFGTLIRSTGPGRESTHTL